MRVFAIGDIHGCCEALKTLTDALQLTSEDVLVTLGDYVDRGPDSNGAIAHLIALQPQVTLVPLRGNHEIMMKQALLDRDGVLFWLRFGGDATLASYEAESPEDIPVEHLVFLDSTLPYFETENHLFVHANLLPDVPLDKQPDEVLYWQHLSKYWFRKPPRHMSGKTMICGHTSQPSGKILNLGNIICIDTFAHGGQWLTCLEPETGTYWQSNESGDLRTGKLN